MKTSPVYVLGGYQTDFAVNYAKAGQNFLDVFNDTVRGTLEATGVEAKEIQSAHVANFMGELMFGQGHLGAFFLETDPAFAGLPTMRHEAACASGSVAVLAAMAAIEAGRYDCVCVLGVEMEKCLPAGETAKHLGAAAWVERECEGIRFPWPHMFSRLADEYDARYGLDQKHLAALGKKNYDNARRNPNAQTRSWAMTDDHFAENDELNPVIEGRIRRQDCSQVTDGGAAVLLASADFAQRYAARTGRALESIPRIKGWGHHTARIAFDDKVAASKNDRYVFPFVRETIMDAMGRANISDVYAFDAIEVHDCFTPTEYMAIDHFGLTAPGESWKAIEEGVVAFGGRVPINASGGLIGLGHPVGATGIRMVLDGWKQTTESAGEYQVPGARNIGTLNIGGSATTAVSFVVGV
ncbi:MAG: thiolase domain-containing protein [Candidatus Hydrogenedens sp.]|nr:thiolase domain-containing protein [Candidatus Hydrogenedens sp.]